MEIQTLVCHTEGTQTMETREVPDNYYDVPDPEKPLTERVAELETGKAEKTEVDELHEALDMILTGTTEEMEAANETGTESKNSGV